MPLTAELLIMTEHKGNADSRPSSARRKILREGDAAPGSLPEVSSFFPIERYYDAAEKVSHKRGAQLELKLLLDPFRRL